MKLSYLLKTALYQVCNACIFNTYIIRNETVLCVSLIIAFFHYLYGNIIKFNATEKLFFSPYRKPLNVIKLYDNNLYTKHNRSILLINPILLRNKKVFKSID